MTLYRIEAGGGTVAEHMILDAAVILAKAMLKEGFKNCTIIEEENCKIAEEEL